MLDDKNNRACYDSFVIQHGGDDAAILEFIVHSNSHRTTPAQEVFP